MVRYFCYSLFYYKLSCWRRTFGMHVMKANEQLETAARLCEAVLEPDSRQRIVSALGEYGHPDAAFWLLDRGSRANDNFSEVVQLCTSIRAAQDSCEVGRTLLLLACKYAIPQVDSLPVTDRMKELFADEFQFFANPPDIWLPHFRSSDVRFHEMIRIVTFRRFPAGLFHWEVSGFPRSWLLKANQPWKVLGYILRQMKGFRPLFEMHLNERRKNRLFLNERDACRSYCRAANSMRMQSSAKGLMSASWLFCDDTARFSPHLAWLSRTPLSEGAFVVDLGPAPPDSGFLVGSEKRRKLYDEGLFRPRTACLLWPRESLLAWADRHVEFHS